MNTRIPLSLLLLLPACGDPGSDVGGSTGTGSDAEGQLLDGWLAADGTCALGEADPSRLVVTTTDFATGAVSVVDLEDASVEPDVALGSTDAVPFVHDGLVYVVHRGLDYIDVLDPEQGWQSRGEYQLGESDEVLNPQSIAFGPDGLAYVTLYAAPEMRVIDGLSNPDTAEEVGRIDLSAFADADGLPEASATVRCGSVLYVAVQRLDVEAEYEPTGKEWIVPVSVDERLAADVDPDAESGQGLAVQGDGIKQLRPDPADEDGSTVLALTTGIERIDLEAGEVGWAVPQRVFAEAGIDQRWLPIAFDVDSSGTMAYVVAYEPDFSGVNLYRVGLDDNAPTSLEPFGETLNAGMPTLELVDDRLWFGSTAMEAPGMWAFTLEDETPEPTTEEPLSTGLPPYTVAGLQ